MSSFLRTTELPWFLTGILALAVLVLLFLYFRNKRSLKNFNLEKLLGHSHQHRNIQILLDSIPDWAFVKDHKHRFVLLNKRTTEVTGFPNPSHLLGKTEMDVFPPELARITLEEEKEVLSHGTALIDRMYRFRDQEGKSHMVKASLIPLKNPLGRIIGLVGIGRDLFDDAYNENRLRELSLVASGTDNVVVIMDKEGNFEWVNKGFEKRYGHDLKSFVARKGMNLRDSSSNENIQDIITDVLKSKQPRSYSSSLDTGDGKMNWFQSNLTPILDEAGEVRSLVLIDADITAMKEADLKISQQKQKLQEQKEELENMNKSKDRLFSIIAHDLKNPFQSIIGFTDLLRKEFTTFSESQIAEYLDLIHEASTSAYDLLFNLLEWSRAQTRSVQIKPVRLPLDLVVREILGQHHLQARNKGIQLENRVDPELAAEADLNMIRTVVRNLTNNAIKYTDRGGTVSFSSAMENGNVLLSIRDSGIGIPEDRIKTLFSLEHSKSTAGTAGETGTGIGLLVVHDFLELNQGNLRVESTPGAGSVFSIRLPRFAE
ncbi:MAG: PAS domain-containing protein [Bacteroidales bacterium]